MNHASRAVRRPPVATIHWASQYDLFTGLMGMGVDRSNSRMVIELAKIKPGDKVLDVACGTGNLTLTAQSYAGSAGKVHGIDAAPEMIEVAKQKAARFRPDVVFDVGLAEKLAFPDASFDVVISRLAIHHLPGDLKHQAFAEILRVLKPGGNLLIADFNPPANPVLAHIASALVGAHMMQIDIRTAASAANRRRLRGGHLGTHAFAVPRLCRGQKAGKLTVLRRSPNYPLKESAGHGLCSGAFRALYEGGTIGANEDDGVGESVSIEGSAESSLQARVDCYPRGVRMAAIP